MDTAQIIQQNISFIYFTTEWRYFQRHPFKQQTSLMPAIHQLAMHEHIRILKHISKYDKLDKPKWS